jgi:hypothetical protein
VGRFLVPDALPERLLYAEPLAYFPVGDLADGVLEPGRQA